MVLRNETKNDSVLNVRHALAIDTGDGDERIRMVNPLVALAVGVLFLFLGSGSENLLLAFQMGWTAAAAVARLIGVNLNVVLVESDAIGTIGVGEATVPHIRFFNAKLGIDETELSNATLTITRIRNAS